MCIRIKQLFQGKANSPSGKNQNKKEKEKIPGLACLFKTTVSRKGKY